MMHIAKFVSEITVKDPDTGNDVSIEIYKHNNGGMFAMDSSFLEQIDDADTYPVIIDPFTDRYLISSDYSLMLIG